MFKRLSLLVFVTCALLASCTEGDPSSNSTANNSNSTPNNASTTNANTGTNQVTPGPIYRVASLNTRRFFDTVCDSNRCGDGDFEADPSEAEFNFKADQLAEGIRGLEADAVMLQEVESETALVGLYERLDDLYDIAIIGETGGAGSLDTAILARGNFLSTLGHRDVQLERPDGSTTGFAREFLEVRLEVEGTQIHLFSAHFKSQRNDDPGRRQAEAEGARDIAWVTGQENPDAVVIVAGDLNDTPDSEPLQALTAGNYLLLVQGPPDDWWTYSFGQTFRALDHILLVNNGNGKIDENLLIFRDSTGGYASSDHSAVAVDLELPAAE